MSKFDMKTIPLTKGLEAIVDASDYDALMAYKWYTSRPNGKRQHTYATRHERGVDGESRNVGMHRHIMAAPKGMLVDHINGNTLDNRRANLRLVTSSENNHNKAVRAEYRGVMKQKKRDHYTVRFKFQGKNVCAYGFKTAETAAKFYDDLCVLLSGPGNAVTNFPRPDALRVHVAALRACDEASP